MNLADMPKQFLPLGQKPIVIHTIEKFLTCDQFDEIYVGTHPDWITHMEDLIHQFIVSQIKVTVVPGGKDRNGTLFAAIRRIEADYGEAQDHIIVTHDAVRPFVTLRIINDNIEAAKKYGAADTVIPAVDTIVQSNDGQQIADIPNRRLLYQGQTPQSFNMTLLKRIYAQLTEEEKEILTDSCKICVVRNQPVHLVEGATSNLKITTVTDYKIAQAMLGGTPLD